MQQLEPTSVPDGHDPASRATDQVGTGLDLEQDHPALEVDYVERVPSTPKVHQPADTGRTATARRHS